MNRAGVWLLCIIAGIDAYVAGDGRDGIFAVLALVGVGVMLGRLPAPPRRPSWAEMDHDEWRRQLNAKAARRRYELADEDHNAQRWAAGIPPLLMIFPSDFSGPKDRSRK